jgi:hypothetical protein
MDDGKMDISREIKLMNLRNHKEHWQTGRPFPDNLVVEYIWKLTQCLIQRVKRSKGLVPFLPRYNPIKGLLPRLF